MALCLCFTAFKSDIALATVGDLKKLSVDELLDVEVTSVSRRPEKLSEVASAIQVISREDILRSGATSVPEALRLAPNLQVAQVNSSQWAISARGFNNVLANKLLVLIDGRTVYTPLYAGVFWDVQNILLEDVERIEVISGPGGTLWGANAVNGVINITTRSAEQTQGWYVEGSGGGELRASGALRYGGQLRPDTHFRGYVQTFDRDDTLLLDGTPAADAWRHTQGGLRFDWQGAFDTLTVQSDAYTGKPNPDGATAVSAYGGNLLARWSRVISASSDLQLQGYYDRTVRDFNNGFAERLSTYDLDFQHRLKLGSANELIWGVGTRWMDHEVDNLDLFRFSPAHERLSLYNVFLQDEIMLIEERLRLTLGIKAEHNEYTDWELQPNFKAAWSPDDAQTFWAAVSRAVRTPSRLDRDFYLSLTPTVPFIVGSNFDSENVLAYELGWRSQPHADLSLSVSTFFNEYEGLRTVEPGPPPFGLPVTFSNGLDGETYGAELAATYTLNEAWSLRGGYTFLKKHLELKSTSRDLNLGTAESNDPEHQLVLQWTWNVASGFELDGVLRYVSTLADPRVSQYTDMNLRFAWLPTENIEVSLVGQNLLHSSHLEFIPDSPSPREIERGVVAKVAWRY